MKLEAGDLVLVPFPYTDLSATKTRPALVLSTTTFNQNGPDAVLCAVTSNLTNSAYSVLLEPSDVREGKLAATSRIKFAKIATIERALIRRRVAKISKDLLGRVYREIALIMGPNAH